MSVLADVNLRLLSFDVGFRLDALDRGNHLAPLHMVTLLHIEVGDAAE